MGKIKVNFSQLNEAIKNAGKTATKLETYGELVYSHNYSTLTNIVGGSTEYTADAATKISQKKEELNQMASRFSNYSKTLTNFRNLVEEKDASLSSTIEGWAKTFTEQHSIACGPVESAWRWICDGASSILNSTVLGQWIHNSLREVGDWFSNRWDDLKEWYAFDGGEFVVNIVLGLAAIAAAIFTIVTAGVGFVAFFAVVGAYIAIANAIFQIGTSVVALVNQNKDPAWARRCAKDKKVSDFLETNWPDNKVLQIIGGTIDTIDCICAVIDITDGLTKAYTKITGNQTLFQKYLGAGGIFDSAFVQYVGDEATQACQYNAIVGRWEVLDDSGNIKLGVNGEPVTVDFSKKADIENYELKWNLKTGISNLKAEFYGQSMWKYYGNMLAEDIVQSATQKSTNVRNVLSYAKDVFTSDYKDGIRKIAGDISNAWQNYYGTIRVEPNFDNALNAVELEDQWLNYHISMLDAKVQTVKNGVTLVWGEAKEVITNLVGDGLGIKSVTKAMKNEKTITKLNVSQGLAAYLHIGIAVDTAQKVYTQCNSFMNESTDTLLQNLAMTATKDFIPGEQLKKFIEKQQKLMEAGANLKAAVLSN